MSAVAIEQLQATEPGSPEYFDFVLAEVNWYREEQGRKPLDKLPKAYRRSGGYTSCALGFAFDNLSNVAASVAKDSQVLKDYENRFEGGDFPELVAGVIYRR